MSKPLLWMTPDSAAFYDVLEQLPIPEGGNVHGDLTFTAHGIPDWRDHRKLPTAEYALQCIEQHIIPCTERRLNYRGTLPPTFHADPRLPPPIALSDSRANLGTILHTGGKIHLIHTGIYDTEGFKNFRDHERLHLQMGGYVMEGHLRIWHPNPKPYFQERKEKEEAFLRFTARDPAVLEIWFGELLNDAGERALREWHGRLDELLPH